MVRIKLDFVLLCTVNVEITELNLRILKGSHKDSI